MVAAQMTGDIAAERRLYATEWTRQPNIKESADNLRESQLTEPMQNIMRFMLDGNVPDHLCTEEDRLANVSSRTWVRGLIEPPKLMSISKWIFNELDLS